MPCPICGHTLERLTGETGTGYYHCPRCGTVMVQAVDEDGNQLSGFPKVYVPQLVRRCREFRAALGNPAMGAAGANLTALWHTDGIEEAISLPAN
jgi:DNA-directed RNA polymerase subunit RPC12/RpoP